MQQLTIATKLKIIILVLYLINANLLFIFLFDNSTHQIIGIAITNISFLLWITARIQLGNAFSIAPKSKFLVKTGLYSKLRHPVYYFSIMAVFGLSIFIWNTYAAIVVIALLALEITRIHKEEAILTSTFGQEYLNYKQQTWL